MFKNKNSKYHSILQSIKKQPVKSNLATRHEEITNDLVGNQTKITDLEKEIAEYDEKIKTTTNVSEKNGYNLKKQLKRVKLQQMTTSELTEKVM